MAFEQLQAFQNIPLDLLISVSLGMLQIGNLHRRVESDFVFVYHCDHGLIVGYFSDDYGHCFNAEHLTRRKSSVP